MDGNTYSSKAARQKGLLLIALFKTGCGTCKFAFPFLQRIHTQYALRSGGKFQVWGISQNDAEETAVFAKEYGNATFPSCWIPKLDVSAEYRITNVPDLYLLSEEDTIPFPSSAILARRRSMPSPKPSRISERSYTPIVREEDNAPAIKPG